MAGRMRRYTHSREDHSIVYQKHFRRDEKGLLVGPAVEQLAAYEDSGLTPGQVTAMQKELNNTKSEREILLRRVKELEKDNAVLRSEREYFRSRAEFFQEMALCGKERT